MYSSVTGLIGAALPVGPWSFAINNELAYSSAGPLRGTWPICCWGASLWCWHDTWVAEFIVGQNVMDLWGGRLCLSSAK